MEEDHLPEHINNLWEDMDRLNAMYEELMWDHMDLLEFVPDYENDRIIIKNKSREMNRNKNKIYNVRIHSTSHWAF